ncbi:G-protein coupled receptor daf-37 [Halyomorpha halys]|uniref:G-protein coupled receptor daf-37 n=1 Tax=Halyomorpha halys TaxID=286706 RepID=UPI0006D50A3D|nr:G-protein coupled receptor daf-37 [Halyomorpha halys]XP_014279581.1 G-protein coupled receptor daf-37 [Halyomorpha halys]
MNGTENTLVTPKNKSLYFLQQCRFWIPNVAAPIIFIIGLFGNVMTIVVLTRKRMSGSTNTYLTALAVSDLLYLIFYMTLCLEHHMSDSKYLLYWKYWRFAVWFADATVGISTWLTVSFTLERYIAVCHPLKGKVVCTEARARKVIGCVVMFCLLSTVTTPFEWNAQININPETNKTSPIHHSSLGNNKTYKTIFYWFSGITFVFIPLILLGTLNYLLINAVRISQKKRKNLTEGNSRKNYKEKQENKITIALVAVVFLFLLCQGPSAITLILGIFYSPKIDTDGYNIVHAFGNIFNLLLAVNAAFNFLLYCAMSDKYRQTMYRTFCPSLAINHQRANTFSSNASYRSSMHR